MRPMPGLYEIRYQPEGRVEQFAGSRGNFYEFSDGSRIDLVSVPAWCRQCGDIRHGEQTESVEAIDEELAELLDPTTWAFQRYSDPSFVEIFGREVGEKVRDSRIEALKARRRWREQRVSPAKCIYCGSTDIIVPGCEPFPNPAGAGTIQIGGIGMCSTEFNQWFFTPEGDRIPRDTKPTYWHHPDLDNTPGGLRRWLKKRWGRKQP